MNPFVLLAQEASAADPSAFAQVMAWVTACFSACVAAFHSSAGRLIPATFLGGLGIWMLLPGPSRWAKILGGMSAMLAACLAISVLPPMGVNVESVVFWILASVTLAAAVAMITSPSPVYSAIWFGLVLLGVGGLFLLNGAQFLGVATVAVYAGAIVVTFLFVLMLAQPEGHSFYDRISWGKLPSLLSAFAGVCVAMLLLWAVHESDLAALDSSVADRAILADEHVAGLGGQLFTRHLVGVQLAGTLLLAALVGAVAMASHGSTHRDGQKNAHRERGTVA